MALTLTNASTRLAINSRFVPHHRPGLRLLWLFGWLCLPMATQANEGVDHLLTSDEAPHGVVFEIVEADKTALEELLPRVRAAIERIRNRFPETEFAVVSHGREEFALQSKYRDELPAIHQSVMALVADDVPVHVCETHAGWYQVSAEDFPEYVDVAPTGPGQIRAYLDLDYTLVIME